MLRSTIRPCVRPTFILAGILIVLTASLLAQDKTVWGNREKPIVEQLHGLRKLDDIVRARTTKDLALQIQQLPVVPNKLRLAGALANLSTEDDFGKEALQEFTTTLTLALREQPPAGKPGEPDSLYLELASLVRRAYAGDVGQSSIRRGDGKARSRRRQTTGRRLHPHRFTAESVALARSARKSRAGKFLGDLVPAMPQGNARLGRSLQQV